MTEDFEAEYQRRKAAHEKEAASVHTPNAPTGFEYAGEIGVDAGHIFVGDPCYIYHYLPKKEGEQREQTYKEFEAQRMAQYRDPETGKDYPSKKWKKVAYAFDGMLISSGHGDGGYPVYVKKTRDGLIKEVRIVFIE